MKEADIVAAVIAKLDMNKLTDEVAETFFDKVTSVSEWDRRGSEGFQKLVSDKLATMMAEKILADQEAK